RPGESRDPLFSRTSGGMVGPGFRRDDNLVQRDGIHSREEAMALVPLAAKGNYFHVYDFRVKPGRGDEFIELFNKFDYGDNNPFHRSRAQVKDGVLCRDAADPDHFYLIGEWRDIEEHRRIREAVAREIRPE